MDLDPVVLLPALLFTLVAVYVASSLLGRRPDSSSSAAASKKPKVGYGDDAPPSRALGEPLRAAQPPAAVPVGSIALITQLISSTLTPTPADPPKLFL